jgi:hypothetical protein
VDSAQVDRLVTADAGPDDAQQLSGLAALADSIPGVTARLTARHHESVRWDKESPLQVETGESLPFLNHGCCPSGRLEWDVANTRLLESVQIEGGAHVLLVALQKKRCLVLCFCMFAKV